MITSVSDPHIYSSMAGSVCPFSQIKRKPPPLELASFRYTAADLQNPLSPVWEIRKNPTAETSSNNHVLPRPPTPSDDTHDLYNSLYSSDTDTEGNILSPAAPRRRPRARTLPSKRFFTLVRVPPPTVDIDLLTTARSSGSLRPASLPERVINYPAANIVADDLGDETLHPSNAAVAESDILPTPPSGPSLKRRKSFRKSTFGFIEKRKSIFRGSQHISVAAISAPLIHTSPRKYSVASMVSTANASMISLSAFTQPPASIPPVPQLPSKLPPPPSRLSTPEPPRQSYTLQVDLPVEASGISNVDLQAAPSSEAHLSDDAKGKGAQISHTLQVDPLPLQYVAPRPALVEARSSYTLELDPLPQPTPTSTPASHIAPPISGSTGRNREVHFDFGEPPDFDGFDETQLPTQRQLEEAAALPVISESGVRVAFGSLWQGQKTIVCFIRHFWCPLCQDYMFSISQNVLPEVLHAADIELVIISNGSYEMIKSYRRIFRTPFALYTDPTHKVYNALGMTLQTLEKGPRGNYVRHGLMSGIRMVVVNAVKVGMPVWKEGGKISQLGGEFILGPGMTCSWVHRMRYTRSHVPILQVIEAAGVDMYTPLHRAQSSTGGSFLGTSSEEESKWMKRRRKVLKKLRGKKMSRRGGTQYIDTASTTTAGSSSTTPSSSNRSSVGSEATRNLCSWDPSTEQAINVGLIGYEAAIIEEVEQEQAAEAEIIAQDASPAQEGRLPVDEATLNDASLENLRDTESELSRDTDLFVSRDEAKSKSSQDSDSSFSQEDDPKAPLQILNDVKSEPTRDSDSSVSRDDDRKVPLPGLTDTKSESSGDSDSFSELAMSSTMEVESTDDGHLVNVHFDPVAIHFDSKNRHSDDSLRSHGSLSTIGSGFEFVVEHHRKRFFGLADETTSPISITASLSESSLDSF